MDVGGGGFGAMCKKLNPALRGGINNIGIEWDMSKSIGKASFTKFGKSTE